MPSISQYSIRCDVSCQHYYSLTAHSLTVLVNTILVAQEDALNHGIHFKKLNFTVTCKARAIAVAAA